MDRQLHIIAILLNGERDKSLCFLAEVPLQLRHLLAGVCMDILRQANFLFLHLNFHHWPLLSDDSGVLLFTIIP